VAAEIARLGDWRIHLINRANKSEPTHRILATSLRGEVSTPRPPLTSHFSLLTFHLSPFTSPFTPSLRS
jgi:hypothetical protein